VFADTNLLLDILPKREPFCAAAARSWTLAEIGACEASARRCRWSRGQA
jgi:hypothetical protein